MQPIDRIYLAVRRSRLARASAWISLLQFVPKLQTIVVIAVAGRTLTLAGFGAFASVQAVGLLAAAIWDAGATSYIIRETAMTDAAPKFVVRAVLKIRLYSGLPVFGVTLAFIFVSKVYSHIGIVATCLILASSAVAAVHTVYNAALVGRSRFASAVRIASLARVATSVLLPVPLVLGWSSEERDSIWLAGCLLFAELLILVQQSTAFRRISEAGSTNELPAYRLPNVIRAVGAYFANSMFNFAYNRLDQLLVVALVGVIAAGEYAPGSQLQNMLAVIASVMAGGLVPTARRHAGSDRVVAVLNRVTIRLCGAGLAVAVVILPFLFIEMQWVLRIIVGESNPASVASARILIFVFPLLAVQVPLAEALIAAGRVSVTTRAYAVGLLASLGTHFVLDPHLGARGAAIASLIRDPVVLILIYIAYRRALRTESNQYVGTHRAWA